MAAAVPMVEATGGQGPHMAGKEKSNGGKYPWRGLGRKRKRQDACPACLQPTRMAASFRRISPDA